MKPICSINNFEIKLYFLLWIICVSYAIYSVTTVANEHFTSPNFEDTYEDFTEGWKIFSRLKDTSDIEWKYVKDLLVNIVPWCFVHLIVAEFLRHKKQFLIYWFAAISLLYISVTFGLKVLIYFILQPILGYLPLQFKSKRIIWLYYVFCLVIINFMKWLNSDVYNLHTSFEYLTTAGIFWINLRSLNYFLEAVNDEKIQKITLNNILTSIAYCLYLPFLFTGPLVLYIDFKTIFESRKVKNVSERLFGLSKNLFRFIFWAIFIEIILHFVYVNALTFQPQIIKNMNSWALYGGGYCMGQFFQLKYVVFYGLSTSLANFEGIPVPSTPKCIGRIHLYSDMWKYFDRGLYIFLLRYIYIPLSEKKNTIKKMFASLMCFSFVYVWHGIQSFIAIWSFLNFLGVAIETIVYELSQKKIVRNITKKLSEPMYRRLKCMLASPLFAMSALSNFYFFAGKEIGDIYVKRFLEGPFYITFNVLIALYIGSQVSTEIKLWECLRKS